MPIKSVCVYCGSRMGNDPAYGADAQALGTALARNGWRLVYGAGDVGLMGTVARAAQDAAPKHSASSPSTLWIGKSAKLI